VNNAVDDAAQDDVYYYGENTYYVAEMDNTDNTNDTDDEYAFYAKKSKTKMTISQTRTKGSY